MSDGEEPYLFDVGVIALAHAGTPVSDTALEVVKDAIAGDIDAVVPYSAVFGAHVVLTNYYGVTNGRASQLMGNFLDAKRIHWHGKTTEPLVRGGLARSAASTIDAWDGYYAQVALDEGVGTILTLDDDFEHVDDVAAQVLLSAEEFESLNQYINS